MRVAVGGFMHESATFSHVPTELDDFRIVEGTELGYALRQGRDELAGAFAVLTKAGLEVLPTLRAGATPSGLVAESAFRSIRDGLVRALQGSVRGTSVPDGVVLALHGSTTVRDVPDAQGELAQAVRAVVGPTVPVVATLDLHATPSDRVLAHVDALVAYRTAPHRDAFETGERAARLLVEILRSGKRPSLAIGRLPLLLPGELGQTDHEPMASLMEAARRAEEDHPEIRNVSILEGYPWADLEDPGVSVLVVASGDPVARPVVLEVTRSLQQRFWDMREDLSGSVTALPVSDALAMARSLSTQGKLVYLSDSGDNPTAGADSDDARLIPVLARSSLPRVTFAVLADPEAVSACRDAGVGALVHLSVGGRLSHRPEVSCDLRGNVTGLAEDDEGGRLVRVTAGNVELVLSERRMGLRRPEVLSAVGIEPRAPGSVHVLKSGYLFPALTDLVTEEHGVSILMATPGASSLDLRQIPYRVLRHPVYPLDPDTKALPAVSYRAPIGSLDGSS